MVRCRTIRAWNIGIQKVSDLPQQLRLDSRELCFGALPHDRQEPIDDFLIDIGMRSAGLSEADGVELIDSLVVMRMDREINVGTRLVRNLLESFE